MLHQVIIIGGGPVGMAAALCLASQGIGSVLIEKHASTTDHPKARGVNCRTMELFRSWDIDGPLERYQLPKEADGFTWLEDFQGKVLTKVMATVDYSKYSPTENTVIAQDDVESEMFKKAQASPLIDLRFNTKMANLSQDDDKVTIEVVNRETDQHEMLTGQYLIAADGASSPIRKKLNVEMDGVENLGTYANIYCEMDLDKYVKHRPSAGFMFIRPDIRGSFMLSKAGYRKWLVGRKLDPDQGITKEAFTDEYCVDFVKQIVNDRDVEVRLINKAFWTMAALVAKDYRIGRVFLAGDAAHQLPPTGGFGMNTGLQDAHNLAWKLAMVIKGEAKDSLLDTYTTERAQVANTNIAWSANNAKRFETIFRSLAMNDLETFKAALEDQTNHLNNSLLDLGFVYGSEYLSQGEYEPTAKVGARAPHCWLTKDDQKISTLDLYSNQFVLLCHPDAKHWQDTFRSFPCKIITIGEEGDYQDTSHDFLKNYEVTKQGAVLVRPDGHVAWHAQDDTGEMVNLPWLT